MLSLLMPVIIAIASPIVTEFLKWGGKKLHATLPPATLPLISTGLGTLAAYIDPIGSGVSMVTGAVSGLAGTGANEVVKQTKKLKKQENIQW